MFKNMLNNMSKIVKNYPIIIFWSTIYLSIIRDLDFMLDVKKQYFEF